MSAAQGLSLPSLDMSASPDTDTDFLKDLALLLIENHHQPRCIRGPVRDRAWSAGETTFSSHPGGYRLTAQVLRENAAKDVPISESLLKRELRRVVRRRAEIDPLIRPKPRIKFLLETDGGTTFRTAQQQLTLLRPRLADVPPGRRTAGADGPFRRGDAAMTSTKNTKSGGGHGADPGPGRPGLARPRAAAMFRIGRPASAGAPGRAGERRGRHPGDHRDRPSRPETADRAPRHLDGPRPGSVPPERRGCRDDGTRRESEAAPPSPAAATVSTPPPPAPDRAKIAAAETALDAASGDRARADGRAADAAPADGPGGQPGRARRPPRPQAGLPDPRPLDSITQAVARGASSAASATSWPRRSRPSAAHPGPNRSRSSARARSPGRWPTTNTTSSSAMAGSPTSISTS